MKLCDLVTAKRSSELRRAPDEALEFNKMSIFKQQKRLWFLAGAGFSGLGLFTLEREAWQGAAVVEAQLPGTRLSSCDEEPLDPMFGTHFWVGLAREWNLGVNAVFQPVVKELARRGL